MIKIFKFKADILYNLIVMKCELLKDYNIDLNFNKDILGSELFFLIKKDFVKNIKNSIPKKIIESKKNKDRIYDNLFCHWYFWEAYISDYNNYHPLLLENEPSYESLRNILKDYFKNDESNIMIDEVINNLNLNKKILNAIDYLKEHDLKCSYNIQNYFNYKKIIVKTEIENHSILFSKDKAEELIEKIGEEKFIRLLFRYYVLGSHNNQLATNETKLEEINPDLELFASGFNNYCESFCSIFPDLECELGSIGRFQDMEILEGTYQINPPFQTTMIYDILKRIKKWISNANNNKLDLEFHLFLPDWLKNNNNLEYSKYLVLDLANEIEGEVKVINLKNTDFDYIDYWNNKTRNHTLPNTLYLIIKNKN